MNVMVVNVGTTSVSVSWDAVNDADILYTVTFTRATGNEQQGVCTHSQHTASVTVDATSTTASIDIGENVEESVTNMLRAYSTYFITMVAVTYEGGISDDSDQISIQSYCVCVCVCVCTGAAKPPNVRVSVINSTSFFVEWGIVSLCRAMNGLITSYSIRYTIQSNGIPQTTLQSDGLEITLTGLTPFTEYSIEVAAVNENDDVGVYSEPEVAITDEARMLTLLYLVLSFSLAPGPVSDITSFPSFFIITITWEQPAMPNGVLRDYRVIWTKRFYTDNRRRCT